MGNLVHRWWKGVLHVRVWRFRTKAEGSLGNSESRVSAMGPTHVAGKVNTSVMRSDEKRWAEYHTVVTVWIEGELWRAEVAVEGDTFPPADKLVLTGEILI